MKYHREDFEYPDLYPAHIVWLFGVAGFSLGCTVCAFFLGL